MFVFVTRSLQNVGPNYAIFDYIKGIRQTDQNIKIYVCALSSRNPSSTFMKYASLLEIEIVSFRELLALRKRLTKLDTLFTNLLIPDLIIRGLFSIIPGPQVVTFIQSLAHEELPLKYGRVLGSLAAFTHQNALLKLKGDLICVSNTLYKFYSQKKTKNRVKLLYNPIDFHQVKSHRNLRKVIFAAGMEKRKNPVEALSFFERYNLSSKKQLKLDIFGEGKLKEQLQTEYLENKNIAFRGYSQNLIHELHSASIYISASLSEGFPLAAQQALMSGCKCVLTNIDQHQELIRFSNNVFIYEAGNFTSFSGAMDIAMEHLLQRKDDMQETDMIDFLSPVLRAKALLEFTRTNTNDSF
jgi:glycosyltransferase involved in cell wall biosynthesis